MNRRPAVAAAGVIVAAAMGAAAVWWALSTAPGFEEVALPPPVAVGVGLAADADASPRGVIIVEDAEELADTTLWVSASQEDCPIDPDAPPCEVDPSLFPRFEFDAWLNADERVTIRGVDGEAAPTLRVAGIGTHETEARVDLSDAPVGASCLMVSFSDDLRERIERDVAPAGHVFALGVVVERPEPFHCRVGHTLTPVSRVTANWAHGCGPPLITTEPNSWLTSVSSNPVFIRRCTRSSTKKRCRLHRDGTCSNGGLRRS
jgi:hypothetical protein